MRRSGGSTRVPTETASSAATKSLMHVFGRCRLPSVARTVKRHAKRRSSASVCRPRSVGGRHSSSTCPTERVRLEVKLQGGGPPGPPFLFWGSRGPYQLKRVPRATSFDHDVSAATSERPVVWEGHH